MPLVPTIYGKIDDAEIDAAASAINERCRVIQNLSTLEDLDAINKGDAFTKSEKFLVAGPQDDYERTKDKFKLGGGPAGKQAGRHQQGFKLHVAALPCDAPKILDAVRGALQGRECPWFKIDDIAQVQNMNTQPGKFITIYAKNEEHLTELALKVQQALFNAKLDPANGTFISPNDGSSQPVIGGGDMAIGSSGLLSVRYGTFTGNGNKEVPVSDLKKLPSDKVIWVQDRGNDGGNNAGWVEDDRSIPHNHPSLLPRFQQVTNELHTTLAGQWAEMQQERLSQEQIKQKRHGRVMEPAMQQQLSAQLADYQAGRHEEALSRLNRWQNQWGSSSSADDSHESGSNITNEEAEEIEIAMEAEIGIERALTVAEIMKRQPLVDQDTLNKNRAKMGLGPPPPTAGGSGLRNSQ